MTEQRGDGRPDPGVWVLLDAAAAPALVGQDLPGERAALEAFRERHRLGRHGVDSARFRRGAGAVAVGVGLFLTSGTAAAAATGVLPDQAQHFAHKWFEKVGLSVPDAGPFIERGATTDRRGAELPERQRPSMALPVEELDSPRPVDKQAGTPAPGPDAHDPGTKAEDHHGSPSTAHAQPLPEPAGHGGTQQSHTPVTPAPPGAAPATAPADPPATPPDDPDSTPSVAPTDHPGGSAQDPRRDSPKPATPAAAGAASSQEPPPAHPLDRDPPVEETTQRSPR